jgi:hypothetical protein
MLKEGKVSLILDNLRKSLIQTVILDTHTGTGGCTLRCVGTLSNRPDCKRALARNRRIVNRANRSTTFAH